MTQFQVPGNFGCVTGLIKPLRGLFFPFIFTFCFLTLTLPAAAEERAGYPYIAGAGVSGGPRF
jgi:hypothetical protein